jgi:hypothetical protein
VPELPLLALELLALLALELLDEDAPALPLLALAPLDDGVPLEDGGRPLELLVSSSPHATSTKSRPAPNAQDHARRVTVMATPP